MDVPDRDVANRDAWSPGQNVGYLATVKREDGPWTEPPAAIDL